MTTQWCHLIRCSFKKCYQAMYDWSFKAWFNTPAATAWVIYCRLGQAHLATMNRDHISLKLPEEEERKYEEDEFTMYVMDVSYFSGKLECYFNYQVSSFIILPQVYSFTSLPFPTSQLLLLPFLKSSPKLNAGACRVSSGVERNPVWLNWADWNCRVALLRWWLVMRMMRMMTSP